MVILSGGTQGYALGDSPLCQKSYHGNASCSLATQLMSSNSSLLQCITDISSYDTEDFSKYQMWLSVQI